MSQERKFLLKSFVGVCSGGVAVSQYLNYLQFNSISNAMKTKLESLDAKFEVIDLKFDSVFVKLDAILSETKLVKEMVETRLEAQRRALQDYIDK